MKTARVNVSQLGKELQQLLKKKNDPKTPASEKEKVDKRMLQIFKMMATGDETVAGIKQAGPEFNKANVTAWMRKHVKEYTDPTTGEVNATELAEAACAEFEQKDLGGPLDDPDHWIWDLAVKFAG